MAESPLSPGEWLFVTLAMTGFLLLTVFLRRQFRLGRGWSHNVLVERDRDPVAIPALPGLNGRTRTALFVRGGFAAVPASVSAVLWLAFLACVRLLTATGVDAWGFGAMLCAVLGTLAGAWSVKEWVSPSRWNEPPPWLAETRWWRRRTRRRG